MKPDKDKPRVVPADYPDGEHPFGWEDYWADHKEQAAQYRSFDFPRLSIALAYLAAGLVTGAILGFLVF